MRGRGVARNRVFAFLMVVVVLWVIKALVVSSGDEPKTNDEPEPQVEGVEPHWVEQRIPWGPKGPQESLWFMTCGTMKSKKSRHARGFAGNDGVTGLTLLMLHGAKFSSQDWLDSGIANELLKLDDFDNVCCLDLPGHGKSDAGAPREKAEVLFHVLEVYRRKNSGDESNDSDELNFNNINIDEVVVVAPSASGEFLYPYLLAHADDLVTPIRGVVTIAAMKTPWFVEQWGKRTARNNFLERWLSVWGELDPLTKRWSDLFSAFPSVKTEIIEGAGHAAYLDKPSEFVSLFRRFSWYGFVRS